MYASVDHRHRLVLAKQSPYPVCQVVQGVAMLGEDDELALNPDCSLGVASHLRGRWRTSAGHFGRGFGVHGTAMDFSPAQTASPSSRVLMNNLG